MTRTNALVVVMSLFALAAPADAAGFRGNWPRDTTRTWAGPEYWANRLQDWRIAGGRLECVAGKPRLRMRTVHLLTRRLGAAPGELEMRVRLGTLAPKRKVSGQSFAGFLVGAGGKLDYRAAALVHHSPGTDGGLIAAVDGQGRVFFRDNATGRPSGDKSHGIPRKKWKVEDIELRLSAVAEGDGYKLTLSAHDPASGERLSRATLEEVPAERLVGNLALCSNFGPAADGASYWFRDWEVSGSKVEAHDDRRFGPVLSAQHTLSGNVLKLTAQMPPLGENDTNTARLEIRHADDEPWRQVDERRVIVPGYTVPLRVENWHSTRETQYRVVYSLRRAGGKLEDCAFEGRIRRDPVDKKTIVVAAFTGNHNTNRYGVGVERGIPWTTDGIWFPHADLTGRVAAHRPDVLIFTGDQVYEGASPTRPDLEHIYLDYLYKWYLWCWAYGDLAREIPTVCMPDDHDVYQGNLWGAGGRHVEHQDDGGYTRPAEFVKMVERTQTSHLPDPYDPTPIEQGIGVYYCGMSYGRIGFAILEDRKFKSSATVTVPEAKIVNGHFKAPGFDVRKLDVPRARLLGERQLKFLADWAADWRGVDMKVGVSQTVFANVATTHSGGRVVADCDSGGWPQTGRNKALDELRRGFAFMIAGDQHLATLVHHGIDDWDDAGYSLCVPSIANFYVRQWQPPGPGKNHQEGMPPYTGRYLDGFGNHITVYAAANPNGATGHQPAALHDRMPGYGLVKLNKHDRTITVECWPRHADPTDPAAKQYPGWPRTIRQQDNYGRKAAAYLPTLQFAGMTDPVVQIVDESDARIVYTIRAHGTTFRPKVFKAGQYTIRLGQPGTPRMKELTHVRALPPGTHETLQVQ